MNAGAAAGDGLFKHGGGIDDAVEHDRELTSGAGGALAVLAGDFGEFAGTNGVEAQIDLHLAGHLVGGVGRVGEVGAVHLRAALDKDRVIHVGIADAILFEHEDISGRRVAERAQRARVGLRHGDVADVAETAAPHFGHFEAARRDPLVEELRAEIGRARRYEPEVEERHGADELLGAGALLLRGAGHLDVDAAVAALGDDGLLGADRVDALADDLHGDVVGGGDRFGHAVGDLGVGGVGMALADRLLKRGLVELDGEAVAAAKIEAEAHFLLGRIDEEQGRGRQKRDDEPFPPEIGFH